MSVILTEDVKQNRFFKSYVEIGMAKAQESYSTLENYSPAMATIVGIALSQGQSWTPQLIQDLTVDGVEYLDELLETALNRAKELKGTLTREDVIKLVEQLKSEASQAQTQVTGKMTEYLPSSSIQDFELKEKVNEIMSQVLSQPQILKEKASGLAQDLHTNLDEDKDGKVSVKDLCVKTLEVTQTATGYASTAFETVSNSYLVNMPKDRLEEYVLPLATPYLESIKTQWEKGEAFTNAFIPLWSAIEVLKAYATLYAANVQSKFDPLSPYLMDLLTSTSVMNVPLEILQVLQVATGYVTDKEKDAVVMDTRALFWALIDISFLLEILKEDKKDEAKPDHNTEGVDFVKDAQIDQQKLN